MNALEPINRSDREVICIVRQCFTAFGGSVIVNNPHHNQATTLVRPLGAAERLFCRYSERNPSHSTIVAEFDEVLGVNRVWPALAAVQRRHPLLSVHVEDRPGIRLGFYRAQTVPPVELTVLRGPELAWQAAAAEELSRPFDRSRAPLMRALLLQDPSRSALLLTFDHTIADGISSIVVLTDVIAALNGQTLSSLPVPQAQENLIANTIDPADPPDPTALSDDLRAQPDRWRTSDWSHHLRGQVADGDVWLQRAGHVLEERG